MWLASLPAEMPTCGDAYLQGRGVEKNTVRGVSMFSVAAGMGSEQSCGVLGVVNEQGAVGFDKDPQEATRDANVGHQQRLRGDARAGGRLAARAPVDTCHDPCMSRLSDAVTLPPPLLPSGEGPRAAF